MTLQPKKMLQLKSPDYPVYYDIYYYTLNNKYLRLTIYNFHKFIVIYYSCIAQFILFLKILKAILRINSNYRFVK